VHCCEPNQHDHGEVNEPLSVFSSSRRLRAREERDAEKNAEGDAASDKVSQAEPVSELPVAGSAHVNVGVDSLNKACLLACINLLQSLRLFSLNGFLALVTALIPTEV